jgi:hypothetical protein
MAREEENLRNKSILKKLGYATVLTRFYYSNCFQKPAAFSQLDEKVNFLKYKFQHSAGFTPFTLISAAFKAKKVMIQSIQHVRKLPDNRTHIHLH